jgi:hypothetical protein
MSPLLKSPLPRPEGNQTNAKARGRMVRALLSILGVTATVAAGALLIPAGAGAGRHHHGHHHNHHHPTAPPGPPSVAGPEFGSVTVSPDGPGRRVVTVGPTAPPLSFLLVCDLPTSGCVQATLVSGTWVARLPAAEADRYSIGLIGRSEGTWVTGNESSDPPAVIPPLVNIG